MAEIFDMWARNWKGTAEKNLMRAVNNNGEWRWKQSCSKNGVFN